MENKRTLKRRHLLYNLQILDRNTEKPVGFLVDMTTEGIMMISEQNIETDKKYELKIMLPSSMGDDKQIAIDAKSIWSQPDINPDYFATGFKVENISRQDVLQIEKLFHEIGFND